MSSHNKILYITLLFCFACIFYIFKKIEVQNELLMSELNISKENENSIIYTLKKNNNENNIQPNNIEHYFLEKLFYFYNISILLYIHTKRN